MLYWESKRRLNSLREFRELVITYFSGLRHQGWPATEPVESDSSQRARLEINRRLSHIKYSMSLAGVGCTVYYSPPPAIGGIAANIDLLANIFELHTFHISGQRVVDCLDRAIGDYERRTDWLFKQLFNPLFWAKWLLANLLSVPFGILGMAGFDAQRIEQSLAGRLLKAVVGFVAFLAGLLAVLDYLDYLSAFRNWLHSFIR